MFEFEEFKKEVIANYRELLSKQELDIKLENPSPGYLRDLSLKLFAHGLSKEDARVFQDFFNPTQRHDDLELSIRRFPLDKLKPVKNFITAKTSNPDEDIVKLLAILTQFTPRPFQKWRELRRSKNRETVNEMLPVNTTTSEQKNESPIPEASDLETIHLQAQMIHTENKNQDYLNQSETPAIPIKQRILTLNGKQEKQFACEGNIIGKPPSHDIPLKVHITFSGFQFKYFAYLFSMISFMITILAVIHFLTAKPYNYSIKVQYVTVDPQVYERYPNLVRLNQKDADQLININHTDSLVRTATPAVQFSKILNQYLSKGYPFDPTKTSP